MLMGFEPLDFMSQDKWQSFLDLVKVPYTVMNEVVRVVVDTKEVHVTYGPGDSLNTTSYDPDNELPGC